MYLLSDFVRDLVRDFGALDRLGTARSYESTLCSVISYNGRPPLLSEVFTPPWLSGYQDWLVYHGLRWNTVSFYMRVLQTTYHRALDRDLVSPIPRLFAHVFTGHDATSKRSLSSDSVLCLLESDLSDDPRLCFSRDMFMLSFYLQGIAFVDLTFLRKSDLRNGTLTYHRRKSGSVINTPVCREALEIIRRYESKTVDSPYLLPLIKSPGVDEYRQYQNALRSHNRRLKRLAVRLDLSENLTSYVSRHSWATLAHRSGVPTGVISQALGHRTETVTRIYLAGFETCALNTANQTLLTNLFSSRSRSEGHKQENVSLCRRERHLMLQT